MAKQIINVGTSANDGTGDKNRVAFQKCNSNFDELYNSIQPTQQYKFLLSQTGGDDPQTATSGTSAVVPIATTTPITPIPVVGTSTSTVVEPTVIAPPPKRSYRHSAPAPPALPPPPQIIVAPPYAYPQYINGIPVLQTLYDGLVAIPNTLFPSVEDNSKQEAVATKTNVAEQSITTAKNNSAKTIVVVSAIALGF